MGYDFTGGRISHFPIDFCMGLTTVQRKGAACDDFRLSLALVLTFWCCTVNYCVTWYHIAASWELCSVTYTVTMSASQLHLPDWVASQVLFKPLTYINFDSFASNTAQLSQALNYLSCINLQSVWYHFHKCEPIATEFCTHKHCYKQYRLAFLRTTGAEVAQGEKVIIFCCCLWTMFTVYYVWNHAVFLLSSKSLSVRHYYKQCINCNWNLLILK